MIAYSCDPTSEVLFHNTPEAAVNAFLAEREGPKPTKILACAWKRTKLPSAKAIAKTIGDLVMEHLDVHYSASSDGPSKASPELKRAFLDLAKMVRAEYVPFDYERAPKLDVWVEASP